jgi:hypothetical protein
LIIDNSQFPKAQILKCFLPSLPSGESRIRNVSPEEMLDIIGGNMPGENGTDLVFTP